jgi:hypothetical protein
MVGQKAAGARASEFVGYLYDAYDDFVRVAVFVYEAEFYHGVVALYLAFDVDDLVVLQMLLQFFLEDGQGVGKIYF